MLTQLQAVLPWVSAAWVISRQIGNERTQALWITVRVRDQWLWEIGVDIRDYHFDTKAGLNAAATGHPQGIVRGLRMTRIVPPFDLMRTPTRAAK
jgi:hypothetical protein